MLRKMAVLLSMLVLMTHLSQKTVYAEEESLILAPHGVLIEASTGTIIYEKEKDTKVSPASITKIMTLLLIFDALEQGTLHREDEVITSAYAKSMGGSQVFLEEGEKQSVETMIKCIVIASGNDASVAMAEQIAGSESEFVAKMNVRAAGLGMNSTNFEDCCGLTDSTNHYTTAYDVALMARELVTKYPEILEYSAIWMEDITHTTSKGSTTFGLTNTNKLVRGYEGCVGLKTGSTSIAKYCVAAVAIRKNITLISVVMTAPDYKVRFKDAAAMLNLGFGTCNLYTDKNEDHIAPITVKKSVLSEVACTYEKEFSYLDTVGQPLDGIKKKIIMQEDICAPLEAGASVGKAEYYIGDNQIGSVNIVVKEAIRESNFMDYLKKTLQIWMA